MRVCLIQYLNNMHVVLSLAQAFRKSDSTKPLKFPNFFPRMNLTSKNKEARCYINCTVRQIMIREYVNTSFRLFSFLNNQ